MPAGEFELIDRYFTRRGAQREDVLRGVGDDGALIAAPAGGTLVFALDTIVEGGHFPAGFDARFVGHRALAVNLSDLAAMGAEPRAVLLSLALPGGMPVEAFEAMLDGFLRQAHAHRAALLGGNVTSTPGPLVINVTAIGTVRPRRALTRAGARPGDELYVTGAVGDAATGLAMLRAAAAGTTAESVCVTRYLRPEARVRAGLQLSHHGAASSCVDLSDGLADGLRQLARASGVGVEVETASLPISDESRAWHAAAGRDPEATALGGGDDYELLFTVRPRHRGRLRGARRRIGDLPITRIGVVTRGPGLVVRDASGGRELPHGFEHFR